MCNSISLQEYLKNPIVAKRFKYQLEIKSKVRHKVIESFEDFEKEDQEFLLLLKKELFNNDTIYVFGSRVKGTYLTEEEYKKYSKEYPNVKKSDWDIRSNTIPKVKKFLGYKIDFTKGSTGIKV